MLTVFRRFPAIQLSKCLVFGMLACASGLGFSQSGDGASVPPAESPAPAPAASAIVIQPPPRIVSLAPQWGQLSATQQQSLAPLASAWDSLSDGHRKKWIALAQNYPALSSVEQEKMHSRMLEWAALKPRERELARLNFGATKKLAPPDRASDWEAYKALSAQERKQLVDTAKQKPKGAAASVKTTTAGKLVKVPVTRLNSAGNKAADEQKNAIDPRTLLPKPTARQPDASPADSK
jgi:hypothetical protein